MTKNTYNPYEIMMDKYDKEEMLSDVREAMLYKQRNKRWRDITHPLDKRKMCCGR